MFYVRSYQVHKITMTTLERGRRGGERMVVGFTTTCAINAYHH
jgi:hypothetical protein